MTMKGFVFTLDAIFSLVFAAFAVAALIYVSYSGYIPPSVQSAQVSSVSGTLLSMTIGQLNPSSPLYGAGGTGTWPQYGGTEGYSFGSASGPAGPYLLFSYTAPASIVPAVVAGDGFVAFASANQIYELNATSGAPANNYPVNNPNTIASAPVFYRNYIIYANISGWVVAMNAYNGLSKVWARNVGYTKISAPLQIEDGYVEVGASNSIGGGNVYFLDPSSGAVVETDPTVASGKGANVIWIAHRKGQFYVGATAGFNSVALNREYANFSVFPSNSFASYGNFSLIRSANTLAMYGNLTASYSRTGGALNISSVPYYAAPVRSVFTLPAATVNATPSIGGNYTYLLYNGINFYAFSQGGKIFNVTLPNSPYQYGYSDVAIAYGNAYVPDGSTLYVFGTGGYLNQNTSILAALGNLYLNGRAGLADDVLYKTYGSANLGMFINGTYAPSLQVAKFNGVNSAISIASTAPFQSNNGPFTLSFWMDPSNIITGSQIILFQNEAYLTTGFRLGFLPTQEICFWTSQSGGTIGNICSTGALSTNGVWYQVTVVVSSQGSSIYINGVNSSNTVGTYIGNTNKLDVGPAGGTSTFNGLLADLQIYNTTLSTGAIQNIYYQGIGGAPVNQSHLVGWWPLLGDTNDYGGKGILGFPTSITYQRTYNAVPPSFSGAVQVGGSGVPLQLTNNGVTGVYNTSVVVWSS